MKQKPSLWNLAKLFLFSMLSFIKGRRQAYETTMISISDIPSALKPVDQFSRFLVRILWDWRPIHHHISNFLQSVIREHGGRNKLSDQSSTADTCFMLLKWWMVIDFLRMCKICQGSICRMWNNVMAAMWKLFSFQFHGDN